MRIKKSLAAVFFVPLLVLAGCGADAEEEASATSEIDTEELDNIINQYKEPLKEEVPTESAPIAEDKMVVVIPCTNASEACARGASSAVEAAEYLGWEARLIDPAGDPEASRQAIDQAIQLDADGIIFTAAVGDQLDANLREAREAGLFLVNSMSPPDEQGRFDVEISPDEDASGEMVAAAIAKDSGGEANVLVIVDRSFSSVQARHDAFEKWLPELCEDCEIVETIETQTSQVQSGLPPQVQAALTANPDIDYIWTHTGMIVVATQATVERSANGDQVKMAAYDGNDANLEYVAAGDKNQFVDVIKPMEHTGYLSIHEMNRLINEGAGDDPTLHAMEKRLVDIDSVPELPWTGDTDWTQEFQDLWDAN